MLALFDLSNLVIRHASNPYNTLEDAEGMDVSGAYGATRQIVRIIRETGASEAIVAGDDSRANLERTKLSPDYKAGRPESDETIRYQFQAVREVLDRLSLPVLKMPGHEADDVIASAAVASPDPVRIVTGDKDLLALCDGKVRVILLRPGKVLECGPQETFDLCGVAPERLRDYKALAGDRSDGIPGVSGIGHKRAVALIEKFGSLENILSRPLPLEGFPPSVSRKLEEEADAARLSWDLAGLETGLTVTPYTAGSWTVEDVDALFADRGAIKRTIKLEGF